MTISKILVMTIMSISINSFAVNIADEEAKTVDINPTNVMIAENGTRITQLPGNGFTCIYDNKESGRITTISVFNTVPSEFQNDVKAGEILLNVLDDKTKNQTLEITQIIKNDAYKNFIVVVAENSGLEINLVYNLSKADGTLIFQHAAGRFNKPITCSQNL